MTRTAHSLSAGAAPPRIQATNIHIALHVDEKVSSIWYLNPQAFGKLSACVTSCDVIVKKFLEQRKDNNGLLACLRREVLSARLYSVSKPAELIFDVLEHVWSLCRQKCDYKPKAASHRRTNGSIRGKVTKHILLFVPLIDLTAR